jgi:hypothetical protein
MLKHSYFQGTEKPKPKKQQYKPEKAVLVQPRFEEIFYKNYDLYDVPGKYGPGSGWNEILQYKSVKDFLNKRRKKLKNKYKNKKTKARINLLNQIIKKAIDFSLDQYVTPILGENGAYVNSIPIGGRGDYYFALNDFEGKRPEQLNFGRDYVEDEEPSPYLKGLATILLQPKEPDLLFPNGFDPEEDLDADKTVNNINQYYDVTNSGNKIYNKMWFV